MNTDEGMAKRANLAIIYRESCHNINRGKFSDITVVLYVICRIVTTQRGWSKLVLVLNKTKRCVIKWKEAES